MPKPNPSIAERSSRRRTAEMLRRLRSLTKEVRMLKAEIEAASKQNARPHFKRSR